MDRSNNRDEFEEFLKGKADMHKLYPSDRVWNAVNRKLHPHRKWYLLGLLVLLSGASLYTIQELNLTDDTTFHSQTKPTIHKALQPAENSDVSAAAGNNAFNNNNVSPISALQANNNTPVAPLAEIPTANKLTSSATLLQAKIIPMFALTPSSIETSEEAFIDAITANTQNITAQATPQAKIVSLHNQYVQEESLDQQRSAIMGELALHSLEVKKPSKFSLQYSFSPIISYRKLEGSNDAKLISTINTIPNALNIQGEVENLVSHLPAPGIELGTSLLYHVRPRLALKTGLQFNYSRYEINAFKSPGEIATISLNGGSNNRAIYNYSQHRNFGGTLPEVLQNSYFQLSIPVGVEWTAIGNDKVQFGIAGSLQPTYLLNKDSYLISTDYKNYTQQPNLLRKLNVYSNAELFVSFQTPTVRWQVGPQFRYQVLSGFRKEYPIKQNLMEYGLKIGVSRPVK